MSGGRGRTEMTEKGSWDKYLPALTLVPTCHCWPTFWDKGRTAKGEKKRMVVRMREKLLRHEGCCVQLKQGWQIIGKSLCCYCLKRIKIKRNWTTQKSRVGTLTLSLPNIQWVPTNISSVDSLKRRKTCIEPQKLLSSTATALLPLTWLWDLSK